MVPAIVPHIIAEMFWFQGTIIVCVIGVAVVADIPHLQATVLQHHGKPTTDFVHGDGDGVVLPATANYSASLLWLALRTPHGSYRDAVGTHTLYIAHLID